MQQGLIFNDPASDNENYFPHIIVQLPDPDGEPFNTDVLLVYPNGDQLETDLDQLRTGDYATEVVTAENGIEMIIVYSTAEQAKFEATINLCRTLYVTFVLAISAVFFSSTANKLVLHPLERMLEIVQKIAKDPASASA